MTLPTDIEREKATHKPTLKGLILAPPAFFCFSAYAQLAHLALPDTQNDPSQSQKSQFFAFTHNTENVLLLKDK